MKFVDITATIISNYAMHYFRQCLTLITKVLQSSRYSKNDIEEILLVGGSTRIPRIQTMIKQYFNGKEPTKQLNPAHSAAFGAAIEATIQQ